MIKKILLLVTVTVVAWWLLTPPRLEHESVTFAPLHIVVPVEPTNMPNPVFRDRIVLPNNMLCPQWAQMAIDTGWQETDLARLDAIMHRESRCYTAVHYSEDPNGGSYGLMQINAYWCKPSPWYPSGYLQAFGILERCDELFYPRINLLSARLIWLYSDRENDDGWAPWRT